VKYLILTHDLVTARTWVSNQDPDIFILNEDDVSLQNPSKFKLNFNDYRYSDAMVDTMRVMCLTYKSQRPLAIIMDMRHQTAVDKIEHDVSILYYDNSKKSRLSYHPIYTTNYKIGDNQNDVFKRILSEL